MKENLEIIHKLTVR